MKVNEQSGVEQKQPLVSVIMPAYNAEEYISEAVQSVMAQTYTNWELLIGRLFNGRHSRQSKVLFGS